MPCPFRPQRGNYNKKTLPAFCVIPIVCPGNKPWLFIKPPLWGGLEGRILPLVSSSGTEGAATKLKKLAGSVPCITPKTYFRHL